MESELSSNNKAALNFMFGITYDGYAKRYLLLLFRYGVLNGALSVTQWGSINNYYKVSSFGSTENPGLHIGMGFAHTFIRL